MRSFVKLFLVLAALTVSTFSLSAQVRITTWGRERERRFNRQPVKEKWDVRFSVAGLPNHATSLYVNGYGWLYGVVDYYYVEPRDYESSMLSTIYADYFGPTRTLGAIGVGFDYAVCKWFSVSMDLALTSFWRDRFDAVSNTSVGTDKAFAFYLLPRAKFMYLNHRTVRLYASFGAGAVFYNGFDKLSYRYEDSSGVHFVDHSLRACAQITPIGVEFGRKLFGFAELGAGSLYVGMQAGIGYKF